MTSKLLKRIAADSNVLLSAAIGKSALKIFTHTPLEVLTTPFNIEEVEEYLPHLCHKYDLDIKYVWPQFKMLPVQVVNESEYAAKLYLAKEFIGSKDPDDVHLAALALINGIPVWSNDKHFKDIPGIIVYPTAKVLKLFDL